MRTTLRHHLRASMLQADVSSCSFVSVYVYMSGLTPTNGDGISRVEQIFHSTRWWPMECMNRNRLHRRRPCTTPLIGIIKGYFIVCIWAFL